MIQFPLVVSVFVFSLINGALLSISVIVPYQCVCLWVCSLVPDCHPQKGIHFAGFLACVCGYLILPDIFTGPPSYQFN